MRFSRSLIERKNPAWADSYLDYDGLKRRINEELSGLDSGIDKELVIVHRLCDQVSTFIQSQLDSFRSQWGITDHGDESQFLSVSHRELEHLFHLVQEAAKQVVELQNFVGLNMSALNRIHEKAAKVGHGLAQDREQDYLVEVLLRSRKWLDNLNEHLAHIHGALQERHRVPRSLLVEAILKDSATDVASRIMDDDVPGLEKVWPREAEDSRDAVISQMLLCAAVHSSVKCQAFLLSRLTRPDAAATFLHTVIKQLKAEPKDHMLHVVKQALGLLQGAAALLQSEDEQKRRPLYYASKYGFELVCQEIITAIRTHGTGPNWDGNDASPLSEAIVNGHLSTVRVLVDAIKHADALQRAQSNVLAIAIQANQEPIAVYLVSEGLGLEFKSRLGRTVLHLAAGKGLADVIESLATHIDINCQDVLGVTALSLASVQGHLEVVDLLVARGADCGIADSRGWLPKDYASYRGHVQIAKALHGQGSPSLVLEPGKKTQPKKIVPTHSPEESVIFVSLGSLDVLKTVAEVDLSPFKEQQFPRVVAETNITLQATLLGDKSQKHRILLPTCTDDSDTPMCFTTSAPDEAKLSFQLYNGSKQPFASAIALLASLKAALGSTRESLVRYHTLPLMTSEGELAGTLTFTFLIARPYMGKLPATEQQTLKPLESTIVGGHRGNGQNRRVQDENELQIGENTLQSFQTAIDHGAAMMEFDVQVTKDNVPVVYHDFLVVEKGMDAPMHTINFNQFMAIGQAQSGTHSQGTARPRRSSTGAPVDTTLVEGLIAQMKNTFQYSDFKANLRTSSIHEPFIKLEQMFHGLPEHAAFDMEIKYPMLFEADDFQMDTFAMELNHFLDTILAVLFKHAGNRQVLISSFSPEVCMLLAVKQQIYPIVFLNDSSLFPTGDRRALSTQSAVHFAHQFGLAGVVMVSDPFIVSPGLIRYIKGRGLFTMTYGSKNDDAECAKIQADAGLDVIIVNKVKKIKLALGNQ